MTQLKPFTVLMVVAIGSALSACSSLTSYVPTFIKPYRTDIQQGNLVTQEDVARLKPGMTKDQVRFILGTPLLNDTFHIDRWDYVYRLTQPNGNIIESKYTVVFENDKLVKFGGQNLPADAAAVSTMTGGSPAPAKPVAAPAPANNTKAAPSPQPTPIKPTDDQIGGTDTAPVLK